MSHTHPLYHLPVPFHTLVRIFLSCPNPLFTFSLLDIIDVNSIRGVIGVVD